MLELRHASGLTLTVDEKAGTATLGSLTLDLEQARWIQICALPAALVTLAGSRGRATAEGGAGEQGSLLPT